MTDNLHIAVLMMVKNEHKRLHVSLESVKDFADSIVIYDTGSTDDTIEIARNFCDENNIILRLGQGEFTDFSTTRNESLDFADSFEDIDYIVLLDTNDELRGGDALRKKCEEYKDKKNSGFLLCQEWWSGKYDKYYNVRMVKARRGWRYFGRVHEWMKNTGYENDEAAIADGDTHVKIDTGIVLFQDRTKDDDKSGKRFARDKLLLMADHKDDPAEPRTIFYLAQTCACLGDLQDAFYYNKLRTSVDGFWEEKFHAYLRCADMSEQLKLPWEESMAWYIKAFEHSERAEPLIKIAEHYTDKNWLLAFTFASMACKLNYPSHCILFVNKHDYDYTRWHLLGKAGWYSNQHKEGKIGCIKALESGINNELEQKNLEYYINEEREIEAKQIDELAGMTKSQFMDHHRREVCAQFPGLKGKQIRSRLNKMWKCRKK